MSAFLTTRITIKQDVEKTITKLGIKTDNNGQYTRASAKQLQHSTKMALGEFICSKNSKLKGCNGMSGLLLKKENPINEVNSYDIIDPTAVMTKYNEEAATEGSKKDKIGYQTAQLMAESQNEANQAVIGAKQGTVEALENMIEPSILTTVLYEADGITRKSIDEVHLFDVFDAIIKGADRTTNKTLLSEAIKLFGFKIQFNKKISVSIGKLKLANKSLEETGLRIGYPSLACIVLANMEAVQHNPWARSFADPIKNVKDTYGHDHVHDETSFNAMVTELAKGDERRNLNEATSTTEEAHHVNGVSQELQEWLQEAYSVAGGDMCYDTSSSEEEEEEAAYSTAKKPIATKRGTSYKKPTKAAEEPKKRTKAEEEQIQKNLNCKYCKRRGGLNKDGKSRHPYSPPEKCHLNKKWKGYRSSWACQQLTGFVYKKKDQFTKELGGTKNADSSDDE